MWLWAQAADGRGVWALIRVDAGGADGFGNSGDVELEPWGLLKSLGPKKPGTFEVPEGDTRIRAWPPPDPPAPFLRALR